MDMALSSSLWSNEQIISFIEAVQSRPCLWDKKSPDFKDRVQKKDEWTAVGLQFDTSHEEAARKFKNLRTYFNRERKNLEKKRKSGRFRESNWFAFKSMHFIKDTDDPDSEVEAEILSEVELSAEDTMESNLQLPPPAPVQPVITKRKKKTEDMECEIVMDLLKHKLSKKSLAFGEHVNEKLMTYSQFVRSQVEYKIATILYEADMGYYDSKNGLPGRQQSPMSSCASPSRQNL